MLKALYFYNQHAELVAIFNFWVLPSHKRDSLGGANELFKDNKIE